MASPSRALRALGALLLLALAGCGEMPRPPEPDLAYVLATWSPGTGSEPGRADLEVDLVNPTPVVLEAVALTVALPRVGELTLELGTVEARGGATRVASRGPAGPGEDPAGLSLVRLGGEKARPALLAFPRLDRVSISYRQGGRPIARDLTASVNQRLAGWIETAGRQAESFEARARRRREALGAQDAAAATPQTTMK